jgi:hypothetical protein
MTRVVNSVLICVSVILAIDVCVTSGLITAWGRWYSPSLAFRQQTEAILDGRLALSESPANATFDLVWSEGGVHQVWGLGAPLWRLPFEAVARLLGYDMFPDRVTFATAIALLTYVILRTLASQLGVRATDDFLVRGPYFFVVLITTVLFPPFLTLLSAPFNVYEEACAYGYLLSVGLLVGLLSLLHSKSFVQFCLLCALAALTAFVRPTLLAYGGATIVVATFLARSFGWRWRRTLTGLALFGLGGVCLMAVNWVRFGSPIEFGYAFQLNIMAEIRMRVAFSKEPLLSAAKELFGSLFFVKKLNGIAFFAPDIVLGQSPTPRWRNFYHSTFDVTFMAGVALSWLISAIKWVRFAERRGKPTLPTIATLWSLSSAIPLTIFYLRSDVMSSRYMLDFAPAFAAAFLALAWRCLSSARNRLPLWQTYAIALFAGLWWTHQVVSAKFFDPPVIPITEEGVRERLSYKPKFSPLANEYVIEKHPSDYGIPSNRDGWRSDNGTAMPIVLLYFQHPGRISLEVRPAPGEQIREEDYEVIKVKIGLEWLALESIIARGDSRVLTFSPPQHLPNRNGVQLLVLVLVDPMDFARPASPFDLIRVANEAATNTTFSPRNVEGQRPRPDDAFQHVITISLTFDKSTRQGSPSPTSNTLNHLADGAINGDACLRYPLELGNGLGLILTQIDLLAVQSDVPSPGGLPQPQFCDSHNDSLPKQV